jgi:hypothetical protein
LFLTNFYNQFLAILLLIPKVISLSKLFIILRTILYQVYFEAKLLSRIRLWKSNYFTYIEI